MTKEQRQAYIAALLQEREGYVRRGLEARVKSVDAELRRLGAQGKAPKDQAERRPAAQVGSEQR